jgi:hypothetical protein
VRGSRFTFQSSSRATSVEIAIERVLVRVVSHWEFSMKLLKSVEAITASISRDPVEPG